jgi:hypothetical protein
MHNEMMGRDNDNAGEAKVGQVHSEESWDSTSTEATFRSKDPPILPDCRLRFFEWPYPSIPSPTSSGAPYLTLNSDGDAKRTERMPRSIPYVPLKIQTTESKDKMFLPGQTYPPDVYPEYVPVLSKQRRRAARNGILEGVLRKATIESALDWTDRTQIQGRNAHVFFALPPRNEDKTLAEVYSKWYLENRKLLRVKPRGDGEELDRTKRHMQKHKIKAKKIVDVYEASQYRPTAVCYLPAYLDFDGSTRGSKHRERKAERTMENLYYIRFPGCDVPHYYFWIRQRQWNDPTTPNTH